MEIWKDVEGYEGLYKVSNLGNIKGIRGTILKPIKRGDYVCVQLCKDGKIKKESIHRIVAIAFIPNPDCLPCVNHKNENKLDNRADNLEWCDVSYNALYGSCSERRVKTFMDNNCKRKAIAQLDDEGRIINTFTGLREAERQTGISNVSISRCCTGKGYKAGGYRWIFK